VRVIPPNGATGSPTEPVATDTVAVPPSNNAVLAAQPAPSAAPIDPPLPRLRPTTPTVAALPQTDAAQPLPSPAAQAAPAAQGDDVGAMMSDIDRILEQHRTATAEPAPLAPPMAAPSDGTAYPAPGYPQATADAGYPQVIGPAPLDNVAPPTRRRGWFLYPATRDAGGMPVPPADIPDPEGAPGQ
jgi:hypothetical protein